MTKYMDIREFVELGLLAEVNRRFFHPVGLALEVNIDDDGEYRLNGIWDCRSDPEGIIFGDVSGPELPRPEAIDRYDSMVKASSRQVRFGWVIQPAQPPDPMTSFTVVKSKDMPKTLGPIPQGHALISERRDG